MEVTGSLKGTKLSSLRASHMLLQSKPRFSTTNSMRDRTAAMGVSDQF